MPEHNVKRLQSERQVHQHRRRVWVFLFYWI